MPRILTLQERLLLKRLTAIFAVYIAIRLFFLFHNGELFARQPIPTLLSALLVGLRFDLAAILLLNGVFLFAWLLPLSWQTTRFFEYVLVWGAWLVNSLFVSANVIDVELYHFTGKRMTFEFANLSGDWGRQAPQLLLYYWPMALGALFFVLLLAWVFYKTAPSHALRRARESERYDHSHLLGKSCASGPRRSALLQGLTLLLFTTLYVLGCRGGWQLKPLQPISAFRLENDRLGALALNSTFTLLHSVHQERVAEMLYFSDAEMADILRKERYSESIPTDQLERTTLQRDSHKPTPAPTLARQKPALNVVIIIMESFALEYFGDENHPGYMPFLKELSSQCLFLKNHFANGRRSIEALPSILAGIPSLMDEPLMTSRYQANTVSGLGQILQKHGYYTAFMHGGKNGTMLFDTFSRRLGYEKYYGLDEYPNAEQDFDGNWGIYDEPFFEFSAKEMGQFPQPFHAVLFSLSSHQPYSVPPKYAGRFPKGTLEVHESIGYADYALRRFFVEAEKQDWFANALFVITADHTQKSERPEFQDTIGHYRAPLFFCHPKKQLPQVDPQRIAQHADILPSILDYLGFQEETLPLFGASIFSHIARPWAINYAAGSYWLIDPWGLSQLSEHGQSVSHFTHTGTFNPTPIKTPAPTPEARQSERFVKALVQYYHSGLINNSWYKAPNPQTSAAIPENGTPAPHE